MRRLTALVMALALIFTVAGAWAEEIQGKVRTVNPADRSIILEDGTQVWVAEGVPMDNVKEGTTVKASYEERDGKKIATSVQVMQ